MSKRTDSDDEGKYGGGEGKYADNDEGKDAGAKLTSHELLQKVQEYFYTNQTLMGLFESFAMDNCSVIDLDSDEYKLKYTELYNVYKGMFEDSIEGYLGTIGATALDLYSALKEATEEDPNSSDAIFGQILFAVSDFDMFMTMMRETAQQVASERARK